jgi:hypothetical protein
MSKSWFSVEKAHHEQVLGVVEISFSFLDYLRSKHLEGQRRVSQDHFDGAVTALNTVSVNMASAISARAEK